MSKPYDATSKDFLEADPAGWVGYLGGSPAAGVEVIDADLATVTTESDRVVRVGGPAPWLLHLEFQANTDDTLPERLLRYNALLQARHRLPAATVLVVLRSAASMTRLTGEHPVAPPVGPGWVFRYTVLRVWERPADEFLAGAVGLVPFAPLAAVRKPDLPAVVHRMRDRIAADADRALAARLWTAAYVLMGLKYDRPLIDSVLSGVQQMEESVTYQAIVERGLTEGLRRGTQQGLQQGLQAARDTLLRLGRKRFGPPATRHEAAVAAVPDLTRLGALSDRLLDVGTWDELLADG